jgi:hypothetical protein
MDRPTSPDALLTCLEGIELPGSDWLAIKRAVLDAAAGGADTATIKALPMYLAGALQAINRAIDRKPPDWAADKREQLRQVAESFRGCACQPADPR